MSEWIPAQPDGPHPSAEELFGAWRQPENEESRLVKRHVAGCAACSEEWLRLESWDRTEPSVDVDAAWARFEAKRHQEAPAASGPSGRVLPFREGSAEGAQRASRRGRYLALAASTLLAAGLAYFWAAERWVDPGESLRGQQGSVGALEAFEPRGTLESPPLGFTFPAQGRTALVVTLRSSDGTYQWTSPASTTGTVEFPEAERSRLLPGVDYWWTVVGGLEVATKQFRMKTP